MKKEHPIFKCIVQVDDQQDCDIARNICEKYELPMWKDVVAAFRYVDYEDKDKSTYLLYVEYDEDATGFCIDRVDDEDKFNIISITQFEEHAEDYNPQFKSVDDILVKLKELNNLLNNK
jgi:hypothetical protein